MVLRILVSEVNSNENIFTHYWFISEPTPLDALLFAYLHIALNPHTKELEKARAEITHRVNLVAWEHKVRVQVQAAFQSAYVQ